MADYPELDKLLAEAADIHNIIRRAFEAGMTVGMRMGTEQERARLAQALGLATGSTVTSSPPPPPHVASIQRVEIGAPTVFSSHTSVSEYGAISNPVRQALRSLAHISEGVGPQEVIDYLSKLPGGTTINIGQVRTALKVLAKREEATRLRRGKYGPGPRLGKPEGPDGSDRQALH